MLGGIEAGGTNFVCAVGSSPADLIRDEFPTSAPQDTVERAAQFFKEHPVSAIGVGCFGPLDLGTGTIGKTPKTAWQHFPIVEALQAATGITKIEIDTDVNAAALGEHRWGAAAGLADFLYLTVGTGVGGGAMVNGRLLHGTSHPEMGHIRIPHDMLRDPFEGACYVHGDCLEGLASGLAIERRWGKPGGQMPATHEAWSLETDYLAQALATFSVTLAPQAIIIGGGVMYSLSYTLLSERVGQLLNGYMSVPAIVPPALGDNAGVLGAIVLAGSAR